jgi:hypothetical protein
MSSAIDKADSTASPTNNNKTNKKWTPNLAGTGTDEGQASNTTATSTTTPAQAEASTRSSLESDVLGENHLDEKENQTQQQQQGRNPQDPTMRTTDEARQQQQQQQKPNDTKPSPETKSSNNDRPSTPTKTKQSLSLSMIPMKKRKRGRYVRVAPVQDASSNAAPGEVTSFSKPSSNAQIMTFPPIPRNQYTATLRRRAIRKFDEGGGSSAPSSVITIKSVGSSVGGGGGGAAAAAAAAASPVLIGVVPEEDDPNYEEYGDISLGMKLIVAGGRVIVQKLIPLSDGRASPAQLVGVIQRGDVLLSIDNLSLVNLPIDQLMEGLKPLSSPVGENGSYQRLMTLRFETGGSVGLALLQNHEKAQAATKERTENGMDAANDMFSLFPMVDQLSGQPLFEEQLCQPKKTLVLAEDSKTKVLRTDDGADYAEEKKTTPRAGSSYVLAGKTVDHHNNKNETADTLISSMLAEQRSHDRKRFASEFFIYKDDLSVWLRTSMGMKYGTGGGRNKHGSSVGGGVGMTQAERVEKGTKVMAVVKALSYNMEDMDRGKDMRSFQRWNTTLSLRSRASVRRRHVLDSASLPAHGRGDSHQHSAIDELGSVDSRCSGASLDGVDGDELLLGLAAHDGIWRKQVIEALNNSIAEMERNGNAEDEQEPDDDEGIIAHDIDAAITKELGTFLFGENMSRIITKKKKSYALPPEEVTSVLFDLTTNIASSAPDEITLFPGQPSASTSNQGSSSQAATPNKKKQVAAGVQSSDVILATRFILEEALPIWLHSFRPLPWEERRVLWPKVRYASTTSDSYGGTNTIFSDDSLTVDSAGSTRTSPQGKNLREIIEDQELDIEARAET